MFKFDFVHTISIAGAGADRGVARGQSFEKIGVFVEIQGVIGILRGACPLDAGQLVAGDGETQDEFGRCVP